MWISLRADQARGLKTPCFVYDANVLRARVAMLRALDAELLCAVKANPHPGVLRVLQPLLDGADVASMGELDAALAAGFAPSTLSFAGPGKSDAELERAAELGAVINVESVRELEVLPSSARVRVRVNAATLFRSYRVPFTGAPSPFGFDEESLDEVLPLLKRFRLEGVHLHAGAQCTSVEGVLTVARVGLALLARVGGTSLNLGGGFGAIAPDNELDVAALAPKLNALIPSPAPAEGQGEGASPEEGEHARAERDADKRGANTRDIRGSGGGSLPHPNPARLTLCFEPGRWLVGPAGLYVTRVVSEKRSRGKHFAILDGGVHHFFSASTVLTPPNARRAPVLNLTRPDAPLVRRELHGVLCTPLDSLGADVELPEPRVGDLLAFQCAGAYGPTFSPTNFLGHPHPLELLVN